MMQEGVTLSNVFGFDWYFFRGPYAAVQRFTIAHSLHKYRCHDTSSVPLCRVAFKQELKALFKLG